MRANDGGQITPAFARQGGRSNKRWSSFLASSRRGRFVLFYLRLFRLFAGGFHTT